MRLSDLRCPALKTSNWKVPQVRAVRRTVHDRDDLLLAERRIPRPERRRAILETLMHRAGVALRPPHVAETHHLALRAHPGALRQVGRLGPRHAIRARPLLLCSFSGLPQFLQGLAGRRSWELVPTHAPFLMTVTAVISVLACSIDHHIASPPSVQKPMARPHLPPCHPRTRSLRRQTCTRTQATAGAMRFGPPCPRRSPALPKQGPSSSQFDQYGAAARDWSSPARSESGRPRAHSSATVPLRTPISRRETRGSLTGDQCCPCAAARGPRTSRCVQSGPA